MTQERIYKDRNLQIICGVVLIAVMGVSSLSPALPEIREALNISRPQTGVLIAAFTLPSVILVPFIGVLADRIGRKRLMVPSLFIFALAGGACALVRDFNLLVVLRVIQGIGVVPLGPAAGAIIGDIFTGKRRNQAMGLYAGMWDVAAALCGLAGGALAGLSWNYPFLLPLIAIPVGIVVQFNLKNPEPEKGQGLREYLGGVWGHLKSLRVLSIFIAGFMLFFIFYGTYITYFGHFLADSFGASPALIGIIIASRGLTTGLVASQLGRLSRLISLANIAKLGFILSAAALVLIRFTPGLGIMPVSSIVFGIGFGMSMASLMTLAVGLAHSRYRGAFIAFYTEMLRIGQTVGPLLIGLAYVYAGFDGVFLYAAGAYLLTGLIGLIGGKIMPSRQPLAGVDS
ncbi:MAG: MFS transporter [Chloroflexota bacterium]